MQPIAQVKVKKAGAKANLKKLLVTEADCQKVQRASQCMKKVSTKLQDNDHLLRDMTNKEGGILSRNSPVQDEMSVNSAIRVSSKLPTLRVAKNESQGTRPAEKENNSTSLHTSSQSEQDITVVVSGAMVLSDSAILKAV